MRLIISSIIITCVLLFFGIKTFAQNKAAVFNGTSNYIFVAKGMGISPLSAFTVEFWVRPQVITATEDYMTFINVNDWTVFRAQLHYWGGLITGTAAWGDAIRIDGTSFGNWRHYAYVFNSGIQTLYINGVKTTEKTIATTSVSFPDGQSWTIGENGIHNFYGAIDELRFWKTARTEQQIKSNYNKELSNPTSISDLVIYMNFNDEKATDLTGKQHNGVIMGAITFENTNWNELILLTADYSNIAYPIDKRKVLNVARGGHGINVDLTWMPGFYDKLVEIGIDEFRIDWLLSDWFYNVVSLDQLGNPVCDFTKLDKIILPMAQKGIKPVMCMCYMASALGNQDGPPDNYSKYKTVIKAYVQHYKDLGYTGWAWESHNEPEGFTKLSANQTYQMYDYFSQAVKEVDNTARVGGYGSVGHDWISYIRSFLDLYKNDATKPAMDFFSFHQYGKQSWEYVPEIQYEFTSRGLPVPALYITEWNNSYGQLQGEGNSGVVGGGFDSNINAAYVAKKMFNSFSYSDVKKIYFWNFADADNTKKFNGDAGLFTVDRHRKAAANTFYFFNNSYESVASATVTGNGTSTKDVYGIVTVDHATKKTSVILWNYSNSEALFKTDINNLPALSSEYIFKAKKFAIDDVHGNYYYDYTNGFDGIGTGPHENALAIDSFTVTNQTFSYSEVLKPYSVIQYRIEPELYFTEISTSGMQGNILQVNPVVFDKEIEIYFTSQERDDVTISIYNMNSCLVKCIENDTPFFGTYNKKIDVSSLNAGIYMVLCRTGDKTEVKKIIKE